MAGRSRRYVRVKKKVLAKVLEKHVDPDKVRTIEAFVGDVGQGGVFIEMGDPPPRGTILEIAFDLPGSGKHVKALGIVRWSSPDADPPGVGVRFAPIPDDVKDDIGRLVEEVIASLWKKAEVLEQALDELGEEDLAIDVRPKVVTKTLGWAGSWVRPRRDSRGVE